LFFLVALPLIGLPLGALADGKPDYGRPGIYLGGGMSVGAPTGMGYVDQMTAVLTIQRDQPTEFRADSAVGANARVGYRIIPWVAVEAQLEWLPGPDVKYFDDQKVVDSSTLNASVNAKAYILPKERFQPFLLFGAGYMRNDADLQSAYDVIVQLSGGPNQGVTINPALIWYGSQDVDGFAARFGGGLDAYFTEQVLFSVDAAYVLPTSSASHLDYVSVGANLYFRF
jgi:hypothetical protein